MNLRPGRRRPTRSTRPQRGAVLIVALVLLLLMTVLSLISLRMVRSKERMAGNTQDGQVAFQAAEAALREAEAFLESPSLPPFDGTGGLYRYASYSTPAPFYFDANNSRGYTKDLIDVAAPPRFVIEQMEAGQASGQSLVVGTSYGGPQRLTYRITALGVGASAKTRTVLQSTFRR